MDAVVQDIRYGIRQLLRQRGSSAVAVLTLALGIGASTAIFSVIDATMLRPLPYPNPEQLVTLGVEMVGPDGDVSRPTPAMADMRLWQESDDVLSAVAAYGSAFRGRIVDGPEPERVRVLQFTEAYLSMHGVTPLLGRDFTMADMENGAPNVALLGYGYWQSRFGGRRDAVGETVRLNDGTATIVGVLPSWFNADLPIARPLRIPADEVARRGTGRVSVYARLQPGVTVEQAAERLSARMTDGPPRPDGSVRETRAGVRSRLATAVSRSRTTVSVIAGAVSLILLIACVNVAGLLLARGAARQSELAIRASIGAGRWRLVRQLLTESFVLALAGGALGVLLAWASLDAIVANIPLSLPTDAPVTLNRAVLTASVALLVPTALLFGFLPALRLSREGMGAALARGDRQSSTTLSRRGSQVLISVEIALAVVLVVGAGVMLRSFARMSAVDLGFEPDGLVTLQVLPLDDDPAVHKAYYPALLQRIRTIPGVSSAGLVDNFPLGGSTAFTSVQVAGESIGVNVFNVLPGYFETIAGTLVDGRLPTDAEYAAGLRGAVINVSAAREMFPDGTAVGRQFTRRGNDPAPWTVLGVVADLRHGGPLNTRSIGAAQVFYPLEPTDRNVNQAMMVVLRSAGRVPDLADRLRQAARSVGPRVLVESVRDANAWFGDRTITPRRRSVLLSLLGGLGLVLALVGVFGMTAYAVARRTREIGVRMAFGARPQQVVGTVVRDSAAPALVGIVLGLGAAVLSTRVIESFLFETAPTDPATFTVVAGVLAVCACVAAWIPARRAARVDPLITLRAE